MAFDPSAAAQPGSGVFGLPHSADDARVVLVPVPFEATTSYGGGAARGPEVILSAGGAARRLGGRAALRAGFRRPHRPAPRREPRRRPLPGRAVGEGRPPRPRPAAARRLRHLRRGRPRPHALPAHRHAGPRGLSFHEALALVGGIVRSGRRIVGFDVVEVAPGPDGDEWDGNVGARLVYKLVGWMLHRGEPASGRPPIS